MKERMYEGKKSVLKSRVVCGEEDEDDEEPVSFLPVLLLLVT